MKKYWIKDLTENQVIHAPTEEIARKLCDKFHDMGMQWFSGRPYSGRSLWDNYKEETCYDLFNRSFSCLNYYIRENYEILTIEQLLDFQDEEKDEEYVLMNKPCLSINEVMSIAYNPTETFTSTSNKLKELVKSKFKIMKGYPKVMEVSRNGKDWRKRVVFMEKNGKFLAWGIVETIEEAENIISVCTWKFAREIQPALELTLDEIAEKFNVSPEQIKIKK